MPPHHTSPQQTCSSQLQGTHTMALLLSEGACVWVSACALSPQVGLELLPALDHDTRDNPGLERTRKPTGTDMRSHSHGCTESPHREHPKGLHTTGDWGHRCGTIAVLRKPLRTLVKYHCLPKHTDSEEDLAQTFSRSTVR